jgi:hypothetical protein
MSGLCLAIDTDITVAINELVRSEFRTLDGLQLLNESALGRELITTSSYEVIKSAIERHDYTLLHMMDHANSQKLCELALIKSNMWENKTEIIVHILPHLFDRGLNALIEKYANEWAPYTGITFHFADTLPAEIIIELNGNSVHSSHIGKNALQFSRRGIATMKLGIGVERQLESIRRPILHEFGHALGCIHEHQSPASPIQWKEPVVIRTYAIAGWDEPKVRHNVFRQYTKSEVTNSKFDPTSIMIYPIPADFTQDGYNVPWNTQLSVNDKAFMRKAYSVI